MDRRTLMKSAIGGISLAIGAMLGIPSLIAAFSPWRRRPPDDGVWRSIGPVDAFPVGQMRQIVVELQAKESSGTLGEVAVFAWRPSEEEVVVYSRSCTDLGCPLTYDPGSECFFCPCHGGIFDKYGNRMAGPPNRPMYRYAHRIAGGEIMVDMYSVPPMA